MKFIILILLCASLNVYGAAMTATRANQFADAIYKVENSAKYPYGIKSIDTKGSEVKARKICITTVKNNYLRWQKAGSKGAFEDFLADRYCPPSADPVGNRNWKKNIRHFLKS